MIDGTVSATATGFWRRVSGRSLRLLRDGPAGLAGGFGGITEALYHLPKRPGLEPAPTPATVTGFYLYALLRASGFVDDTLFGFHTEYLLHKGHT